MWTCILKFCGSCGLASFSRVCDSESGESTLEDISKSEKRKQLCDRNQYSDHAQIAVKHLAGCRAESSLERETQLKFASGRAIGAGCLPIRQTQSCSPSPHLPIVSQLHLFVCCFHLFTVTFTFSLRLLTKSCLIPSSLRQRRHSALVAPIHCLHISHQRWNYGVLGWKHRKIGPGICGYGTYARRILSTRRRQVSHRAALLARFVNAPSPINQHTNLFTHSAYPSRRANCYHLHLPVRLEACLTFRNRQ